MADERPHPWLRGPVEGVPQELQPVAHGLIQTLEEVRAFADGFPDDLLWERVAGLAPVGFHLRHVPGVIDRLFTTAERGAVTEAQRAALRVERRQGDDVATAELVAAVEERIEAALAQLRRTDPATLHEARAVGSKRLPSTVLSLLVHATEHAQRHCGQLLVTTRVVRERAGR